MPDQKIGYYKDRKESLLDEYDQRAALVKDYLVAQYGNDIAARLKDDIRLEYEKLIPEIPYIEGFRAKPMNFFLIVTAQELAVYLGMKNQGKSVEEAWELCHVALRRSLARISRWKVWLMKLFMFSPLVKGIMKRRAQKQEKGNFGDFEIEYLTGKGDDFDFGVNYLHCGNLNFVKTHGGEEFAPYICMSDIALSDALGWGLTRTQTLADGCDHCDFRFKEGCATRLSSKTPEVQETILRIRDQENQNGKESACY